MTGEEVARFLVETQKNEAVIVHSDNPNGVAAIKAVLPNALAVPISTLQSNDRDVARLKALLTKPDLKDTSQVIELFTALMHC